LWLVIDRVGWWRVVYATLAQVFGRLTGRSGGFYRVLGEAISTIDGYTGTMPPFERAIVLAPRNPDAFSQSVYERLRVECTVVDANDLEKAKVLGASSGVDRDAVEKALLDNPHGNGDEQTPVVVIKWRGDGRNPCLVAAGA